MPRPNLPERILQFCFFIFACSRVLQLENPVPGTRLKFQIASAMRIMRFRAREQTGAGQKDLDEMDIEKKVNGKETVLMII